MENLTKDEYVGMLKLWARELTDIAAPFRGVQPPLGIDEIMRLKLKRISREIKEYTEAYEKVGR